MEQNMEIQPEPTVEKKASKKKALVIVGVIVGVIIIAAAAFIGGRFLNQRATAGTGLMPGVGINGGPGVAVGGGNTVAINIQFKPAPELPTTAPDVIGTLAERKDNSLFIQTFSMDTTGGGTGVVISSSSSSALPASSSSPASSTGPSGDMVISGGGGNGPKVEVVVTNDTKIYQDTTPMILSTNGEAPTEVQQTVSPGSLDDIGNQTMITVWGRKVGDRVIADVISFSNPIVVTNP